MLTLEYNTGTVAANRKRGGGKEILAGIAATLIVIAAISIMWVIFRMAQVPRYRILRQKRISYLPVRRDRL